MKAGLPKEWRIHLHCFTGSESMARTLIDHFPNLCIGFTGAITFTKAESDRTTVRNLPLDRILLETDG
jgi:TatD DNase family protein